MRGVSGHGLVDRAEWRWVLGWAVVVIAVSCMPYLYANWVAPPGRIFGGFLINASDGNSYLAKMRQGYEGEWLFRLPFTPEDQRGVLVFTLYLALGHIARLTGLPLVLVFHIARALSGLFLLLSLYRLAAELAPDRAARRWAFAIAAFGSGLAILSLLIGRSDPVGFVPLDLFVPEAVGFYTILSNPHFCLAFALEAWAIVWVVNPPRWGWELEILVAGLIGLGIASLAPYLAPVAAVIAGAGLIATRPIKRDAVVRLAAMIVAMAAFLIYATWAMRSDPAVAQWARQNVTPTPPVVDVILGLGLWLPLAVLGVWRVYKEHGLTSTLVSVVAWLFLTAALLYFPYPLQRRFIGGVFVPLSALAGVGVAWTLSQIGRWRIPAIGGLILFGFSANILVLLALFSAPRTADSAVYLTDDEVAALRWLETQVTPNDVVLADTRMGLYVPGWTGARTVYGHPMETLDATVKRAEVETFYATGSDDGMLDRYRVKYIIGGAMPAGWRTVFGSGEIIVYGR